ncbi:hypothetical protein [Hyphomicrobium sp. 1Nfss2.1]|uniref:hypothetical protein n=1 Tax=Hyphomicrobium sp. 1Nfss2.1 TaxID=3413936 RepID=UPI003C7DFE25
MGTARAIAASTILKPADVERPVVISLTKCGLEDGKPASTAAPTSSIGLQPLATLPADIYGAVARNDGIAPVPAGDNSAPSAGATDGYALVALYACVTTAATRLDN